MPTLPPPHRPERCPRRRGVRALIEEVRASTGLIRAQLVTRSQPPGSGPLTSQAGFMLLEVVISALLVGLIAVGTLAGFEAAGKAGSDQRAHAQATELAAQDEERLRGGTETEPETKTASYSGTTFTITSSAQYASAAKESLSCETTGAAANYVQTTSS